MKEYQEILKRWQMQKMKTPADLDTVLENFRILFAYHPNAIENPETTHHDTREIFENGKVPCSYIFKRAFGFSTNLEEG